MLSGSALSLISLYYSACIMLPGWNNLGTLAFHHIMTIDCSIREHWKIFIQYANYTEHTLAHYAFVHK